jgi:D-alanine-D-alanine ligase
LWDEDPANWAPQNHSCTPNTGYDGLTVIALRNIDPGEELTLDYATFLDDSMEPFVCRCGSAQCRGLITGTKTNSVSSREQKAGV